MRFMGVHTHQSYSIFSTLSFISVHSKKIQKLYASSRTFESWQGQGHFSSISIIFLVQLTSG